MLPLDHASEVLVVTLQPSLFYGRQRPKTHNVAQSITVKASIPDDGAEGGGQVEFKMAFLNAGETPGGSATVHLFIKQIAVW